MKIKFFLLSLLLKSMLIAQKKDNFPKLLYLNNSMETVSNYQKNGYILEIEKVSDSAFRFSYYLANNYKLDVVETYKDVNDKIGNGLFAYYTNGIIDSFGKVENGVRNGNWLFYNNSKNLDFKVFTEKKYINGILEPLNPLVIDTIKSNKDSMTSAKFVGNFKKFLENELRYPPEAQNQKSQGDVILNFTINESGHIETDLFLLKSQNFFLDKESKKIIKKSTGNWIPASLNGKPMKSSIQQKITYKI
jgi:TonB family protein